MAELFGLGLALSVLLAAVGVRLARSPGVEARVGLLAVAEVDSGERRPGPLRREWERLGRALAPLPAATLSAERAERLDHSIEAAGRPAGMRTRQEFLQSKGAAIGVSGFVAVLLLIQGQLVGVPLALALGWIAVDITLSRRARLRQGAIARDLPDFLDVLAISVGSGVGFRPALARVAEATGGPVGEEITRTLREMDLGASRREAFEALRTRNDAESLSQFVTSMLQAEELGVPLADALVDQAQDMRRSSYQEARRRAQRAAPRVSLIVATIMVPAAVLVIGVALFLGADVDVKGFLG